MKILTALAALLFSKLSVANTLIFPGFFEPDLLASGGILDNEFGQGNLQRIDDPDQYWMVTDSWSGAVLN